jgi:hypothetical protein
MDIYKDARALFEQTEVDWTPYEEPMAEPQKPLRPRPEAVVKREEKRQQTLKEKKEEEETPAPKPPEEQLVRTEVAAIGEFRSWSSCTVPLTVVATRDHYADGHDETWFLLDTKEDLRDPRQSRKDYALRTSIEERYRHLKCFCDLMHFYSRAFSVVAHQVVFTLLSLNLLQVYLLREGHEDLTGKTPPRIRQQLLPSDSHIIVYWESYYGFFTPLEFAEIIASLPAPARKKIANKSRRLQRELKESLKTPRPP